MYMYLYVCRYVCMYECMYIYIASFTGIVQCNAVPARPRYEKRERGWEMDGMNDTNDPTYPVERYCMIL